MLPYIYIYIYVYRYLITISMALALLNAVPCYKVDGEFILKSLFHVDDTKKPSSLINAIIIFCTLLVVVNILLSVISLLDNFGS